MMSEDQAADVIFAEVEHAIKKLEEGQPAQALNTLMRVRGTIAAHALKNTNADVGSEHWHRIVNVLREIFPQENRDE